MKRAVSSMFVLVFLVISACFAQDSGYQAGKIVSVKQREAQSPTGGTDAPKKSATSVYDVIVETGGKTYTTVYSTHSDLDPTWKEGKDVDVQVKGKTMYVQVKGKPVKLTIVSSK